MPAITKEIYIEDLLQEIPEAVTYLMDKGIRCMRCGEPMWGTLENACREKGFGDAEIAQFVDELSSLKQ